MGEFLGGIAAGTAEALVRVRELPDPWYDEDEWRTVEALSHLLQLAAAQLWTVFNEAGEADFVEVAQRSLLALGSAEAPTDLALTLDYRMRHLLPEVVNPDILQVAMVEAVIRRSSHSGE